MQLVSGLHVSGVNAALHNVLRSQHTHTHTHTRYVVQPTVVVNHFRSLSLSLFLSLCSVIYCDVVAVHLSSSLSAQLSFYSHADGSRVSIALIRLCDFVCLSVCLSVRTLKSKRLKLKSPNLAPGYIPSRYLAHQLILGQKVKG